MIRYIECNLEVKNSSLDAFLDVEGDFINVNLDSIQALLIKKSVPPFLVRWIDKMQNSRVITSSLEDSSIKNFVMSGTAEIEELNTHNELWYSLYG